MERTEALVIGAGAAGSAAARALALRKVSTVLVEQFSLGHRNGSSHGPTRIFRLSYSERDYVELARRALDAWAELEDAAGEPLLVTTGGIDAGFHAESSARALAACGIEHDWISPGAAAERFTAISFEGLGQILHQPDSAVCLAARAVAAQVRLARAAGVDVRECTTVRRLDVGQSKVVAETDAGPIEADVVVVTAGAWTSKLLAETIELPLRPTLAQVSYFRVSNDNGVASQPIFIETLERPSPWYGYLVPSGCGAQEVKVGVFDGGAYVDPDIGPFSVDVVAERATSEYVRRRFPQLEPEPTSSETCLYTMAPDQDFVLDRIGPVVIGAACSGHGFKFAPLLGELLADLAFDRDPCIPRGRFSAARFLAQLPGPSKG